MDTATGERYVPHVIEPAAGVGRTMLALLSTPTTRRRSSGERAHVLRLHPRWRPVKVAVLPLVNKDGQPELAREIYEELRERVPAEYDAGGSIGKRYRRQDEIGTPWGVTVDGQTIEDGTVTLRDRDTLEQERIPIAGLGDELERRLGRAGPRRTRASRPAGRLTAVTGGIRFAPPDPSGLGGTHGHAGSNALWTTYRNRRRCCGGVRGRA